ncbi:MAG: hypothetical protein HY904_13095 [Deltaproteobacteria bacterium]|nr:hypothetical protein [Deltaproteobacteria bacterium]
MTRGFCAGVLTVLAQPALFHEPHAPAFDGVSDELVAVLRQAPSFYLSGEFTRFPVGFTQLKSGPAAGKYSIDPLTQGPLLQCLLARDNVVDGVLRLLPGRISYQATYRNPENDQWEKATRDVKTAFDRAVSEVKKHCVIHDVMGEIYIGPQALMLLKSGRAEIKASHIMKSK